MQDPISDMLVNIKNYQISGKSTLFVSYSKFKESILKIFKYEGFISNYKLISKGSYKNICIGLKYFSGKPVISSLVRVSKPGLRVYKSYKLIPFIMSGLGVVILSTSKGVLSDKEARVLRIGGEIICYIS